MARKSHRKSRQGCLQCKKRRIKCGEEKPKCQNCHKHEIECEYSSSLLISNSSKKKLRLAADGHRRSASTNLGGEASAAEDERGGGDDGDDDDDDYDYEDDGGSSHVPRGRGPFNTDDLELMHNYCTRVCDLTFTTREVKHVWKFEVPKLALEYPFLMHAMFAFSAGFLFYTYSQPQTAGKYLLSLPLVGTGAGTGADASSASGPGPMSPASPSSGVVPASPATPLPWSRNSPAEFRERAADFEVKSLNHKDLCLRGFRASMARWIADRHDDNLPSDPPGSGGGSSSGDQTLRRRQQQSGSLAIALFVTAALLSVISYCPTTHEETHLENALQTMEMMRGLREIAPLAVGKVRGSPLAPILRERPQTPHREENLPHVPPRDDAPLRSPDMPEHFAALMEAAGAAPGTGAAWLSSSTAAAGAAAAVASPSAAASAASPVSLSSQHHPSLSPVAIPDVTAMDLDDNPSAPLPPPPPPQLIPVPAPAAVPPLQNPTVSTTTTSTTSISAISSPIPPPPPSTDPSSHVRLYADLIGSLFRTFVLLRDASGVTAKQALLGDLQRWAGSLPDPFLADLRAHRPVALAVFGTYAAGFWHMPEIWYAEDWSVSTVFEVAGYLPREWKRCILWPLKVIGREGSL